MHDAACQTARNFTPSTIVAIVTFVAVVSTQSTSAFRALALDRLATRSIARMAWDTLPINRPSNGSYFALLYATTLTLGVGLATVPHVRKRLHRGTTRVALALSILSWVLLLPVEAEGTTPMGTVLTGELVLMFLVQLSSAASGLLPLHSLAVGPLGAVALTPPSLNDDVDVRSPLAVVVSFFMIFLMIPCLDAHTRDLDLLQTLRAANRREVFAFVHVVGGALLMAVRFMPRVRRAHLLSDAMRLVYFAVSINHNVAAAWFLVL